MTTPEIPASPPAPDATGTAPTREQLAALAAELWEVDTNTTLGRARAREKMNRAAAALSALAASPPPGEGRATPPPMTDERLAEPLTPAQLAVLEEFASEMREHVIPEIVATIDRRRLAAAERRGQPLNAHPNDGTWRELHNAWRKRAEEAEAEVDRLRPLAERAARTGLCLSIQQPWAWLIVNGFKDVENRDWPTRVRGLVGIHAGKKLDLDGLAWVRETFPHIPLPDRFDAGGIVGRAVLLDCVSASDSPWFVGRYGFALAHAEPLPFMPCRGQLGFFRPALAAPTPEPTDGAR